MKKPGLTLAAGLFLIVIAVLYLSRPGVAKQPFWFSHKVHVKDAKCTACRAYYEKQAAAGMGRLADCLDCHEGTQSKESENVKEEMKLAQYAEKRTDLRSGW